MTTSQQRNERLMLCDRVLHALQSFRASQPRRFDAGLVDAIELAEDLRRHLADGYDLSPAFVAQAAAALESYLQRADAFDDDDLDDARRALRQLRAFVVHGMSRYAHGPAPVKQRATVSRRTRYAKGLAVRLLPPADRARYREEFAAELGDLPRADQAPYAIRLVFRAWSLRRSLTGRRSRRSVRIVVVRQIPSPVWPG